jgi:holliday junction DNA helicase RuvA
MIGYLRGKIARKDPERVILDINGVGYDLHITANSYSTLPEIGSEAEFFVYTHVREDTLALYGFARELDKEVFLILTSVSGIGPKSGLNILSSMKTEEVLKAIVTKNTGLLSSIPGIGKKTSERIVLELKDKIEKTFPGEIERIKTGKPIVATFKEDLVSALLNLGYKKSVAEEVLTRIEYGKFNSLELALKESLKILAKQP